MRKFLDAVADAQFVPQNDGTVRFMLPKLGHLVLNEAEADGAKLLWRPMVRYYVLGCHAGAIIGLFLPWLGGLLLLTLWIVGISMTQEIKNRFEGQEGKEEGEYDWVYYQRSHLMSRRLAIWLRYLAKAVALLCIASLLWSLEAPPVVGFLELFCLLIVATRWDVFFGRMIASPKAQETWIDTQRR